MDMNHNQTKLIYSEETYKIIGAAMRVHSILGPGFSEKVYQEALAIEFADCGIPFVRETAIHASYKGVVLEGSFIPDFICFDKIIVELKAVRELDDVHRSQAINYAKIAGFKLSLLLNFGEASLVKERFPIK
jgi:GxxExxY protein